MLPMEMFMRLVHERKCVRTSAPLQPEEHIVSQSAFPKLFAGVTDAKETKFILSIFATLEHSLGSLSDTAKMDARQFMQIVLRHGGIHNEEFLHRYLYEFWIDSWIPQASYKPPEEKIFKIKMSYK